MLGEIPPLAPTGQTHHDLGVSFRDAKQAALERWERDYLAHLIETFGGNLSRAAREVQMDRNHLRELLKRYQLEPR